MSCVPPPHNYCYLFLPSELKVSHNWHLSELAAAQMRHLKVLAQYLQVLDQLHTKYHILHYYSSLKSGEAQHKLQYQNTFWSWPCRLKSREPSGGLAFLFSSPSVKMALCHCLQAGVQVSTVHRKQTQGRQQPIRTGNRAMHSQEKSHRGFLFTHEY